MKSKKYLILFTSFILLLTFFALPGESSAQQKSATYKSNNITRNISIQMNSGQAIATVSANKSGSMTAKATYRYFADGRTHTVTAYADNSSFGNSTGTAAVAKSNHSGAITLFAQNDYTQSISGYKFKGYINLP